MKEVIGYKYRSFDNDRNIEALAENFIWASDIASLNDPYECSSQFLIEQEIKTVSRIFSIQLEAKQKIISAINDLKSQTNKVGIYSMSLDPLSPTMWASYAASERGFCIGYNIELLKKHHSAPLKVHECLVEYKDKEPSISLLDIRDNNVLLTKLYATKSKEWQYEKEIRLIFDGKGKKEYPWQSLNEIYFGIKSSEKNQQKIIELLKEHDVRFYQVFKGTRYGELDAKLICEYKRQFKYSTYEYEVLYTNHLPAVENFHIFLKTDNPTSDFLQSFAVDFKDRFATIDANINLYSQRVPINLLKKHSLNEQEKEYLNSVSLGSLSIGCEKLMKWDL